MNRELKILAAFVIIFLGAYFLPLATPEFPADTDPVNAKVTAAIVEAFVLLQWYARNHTLACVVPALFIAGAITTFLSKEAVLKHLGPKANKVEAYSVASISGTVLAVCSCSVLPMFAGIYRVGAGLGPAACFLYAGPAINVLAVFLTARVLGFELGRLVPTERSGARQSNDAFTRTAAIPATALENRGVSDCHDRVFGLQRLVQSRRQSCRAHRRHQV
jgi:uncharacterized membrane protein YraQ (UPF0718 family)